MFDSDTLWLKLNYFRLTHIDDLRKWWVIILVAVDVFLAVFCTTNIILFLVDMPRQQTLMQAMATDLVDYQGIQQRSAPRPLSVESTWAIPLGGGKYDLVAKLKNPNKSWTSNPFDYNFSLNGQAVNLGSDFVLPDSEKYLVASGVIDSGQSAKISAAFTLGEVNWERVVDLVELSKNQFVFEDTDFGSSTLIDNVSVYRVQTTVKNTGYTSFWRAKFLVLLSNSEKIVGANYFNLEQFESGSQKTVTVNVSVSEPPQSAVIVADIDFLDSDNLMTD